MKKKSERASEEALDDLHAHVAKTLKEAINGPATPAAMVAVAVKFLKDNGITAAPSAPRLADLAEGLNLPEFGDEDDADYGVGRVQ